ncbi:MAG: hypothetical protein JXQ90_03870 [Cyclobacteriaceae bacterium]
MKAFITMIMLAALGTAMAKGPEYANDETKEIVRKMIEAHGGYDKWAKAKTFSFDNIMFSKSLPGSPFWISKVTVDQKTRRVYQEWPLHQSKMGYDGEQTWATNWGVGNPPKFEALFFYYFLNLPWLTQDDNVVLGEVNKMHHEVFGKEVYVIDMSFAAKPAVGKTTNDQYQLFIDAESHLLLGYNYTIGYGYMLDLFGLPAGQEVFGPMFRVNDAFVEIDGLIYPNRMHTGNANMTQEYGNHAIINYSMKEPFDEQKVKKPEVAKLDMTSDKRSN